MLKQFMFFSLLLVTNQAFSLIGGNVAKPGEGEGVISIAIEDTENPDNSGMCTATKIGPKVLITAAHCFDMKSPSKVLAFSTKIKNEEFDFDGVEIDKIVYHPSFKLGSDEDEDFGSTTLDIALVFVKEGTNFDDIPVREVDFRFVEPQSKIEYWGYGCQKTVNNTDGYKPLKKFGVNSVQEKNKLQGRFGAFSSLVHKNIDLIYTNNFLSAGLNISKTASSLCWGDSGGPVFMDGKVVGINFSYLSKDLKTDGSSKSGLTDLNLHVRLSIVQKWIEDQINKEVP